MVTGTDLIVDFVNSLEHNVQDARDVELLDSPAALVAWLAERELLEPPAPATDGDLAHARALREAQRDLLGAHNELEADVAGAGAVLDDTARRAGLGVRFAGDAARLQPSAGGVDGALGHVLAAVAAAMGDGTWPRLKVCRADDCLWAYLDTAKNRSRAWCSMQSCGNRAKVRAYRGRRATT
jgi:predicted RNA-binding Zn ribbon-like protein